MVYSRYYGSYGQDGAIRIDMTYSLGEVGLVEAKHQIVAFIKPPGLLLTE